MKAERDLQATLPKIDGRGYKAYKDIQGSYRFHYILHIDHVQGDPFAAPSRLRIQISQTVSQFPESLFSSPSRRIALEDYLARIFDQAIDVTVKGRRGSGKSGRVQIDHCGQEILDRTAVFVNTQQIEARFTVGLPAAGRRVLGREAETMLFRELAEIIRRALLYDRLHQAAIQRHIDVAEDQKVLRNTLNRKTWSHFWPMVPFFPVGAVSMTDRYRRAG